MNEWCDALTFNRSLAVNSFAISSISVVVGRRQQRCEAEKSADVEKNATHVAALMQLYRKRVAHEIVTTESVAVHTGHLPKLYFYK